MAAGLERVTCEDIQKKNIIDKLDCCILKLSITTDGNVCLSVNDYSVTLLSTSVCGT